MSQSQSTEVDVQFCLPKKRPSTLNQPQADNSEWIIQRKKPRLAGETMMAKISEDGDLRDFTLVSKDGARFPCHRNVLAAQSSVIKQMFIHPLEKKKTASLQLGYKAGIVERLVKFFYDRVLGEEEEDEESLGCFLELSEKYDIPHLKEEVEDLAIKKLSVENMVNMFLLADLYSAQRLRTEAESFIKANRLKVKEGLAEMAKLEKCQILKIMSICIV